MNTIAFAAQLSFKEKWNESFNSFGDNGAMVRKFVTDALFDFTYNGYIRAVYHIYNDAEDVLMAFIINGVAGRIGAPDQSS